jgi:hypothetical protein
MKRILFNTNCKVWVRLTAKGKEVYNKHWDKYIRWANITAPELKPDKDGWVEFQLWDLMNIFGESHYNGCDIPFEGNVILFDKADFKTLDKK